MTRTKEATAGTSRIFGETHQSKRLHFVSVSFSGPSSCPDSRRRKRIAITFTQHGKRDTLEQTTPPCSHVQTSSSFGTATSFPKCLQERQTLHCAIEVEPEGFFDLCRAEPSNCRISFDAACKPAVSTTSVQWASKIVGSRPARPTP
jgi:hypothetical protein